MFKNINIENRVKQIKFIEIFLCFCIPWCLSYFVWMILFSINGLPSPGIMMVYNLVFPAIILFLTGTIINLFVSDTGITFRNMVIFALVLALVDQAIKLVVIQYQDISMPVIDTWILIKPTFTSAHFLNRRGIYPPYWSVILTVPLLIFIYCYFCFMKKNKCLSSLAITLLTASMLSSSFDKIIHKGTYDYVYLTQFLVFDLKDVYGMLGLCILFQADIHNQSWDSLKREFFGSLNIEFFKYVYTNAKHLILKVIRRKTEG